MTIIPGRSYQGQDEFVLEVLGGLREGFFLDSGASNGFNGSNSLLLERHFGWHGVCVEPNKAMFETLVKYRSCICVNCCLYDREQDVEFLEDAGVYGGIIDEYDPQFLPFAKKHAINEQGKISTIIKQAKTVRSILRDAHAPKIIDYWSLDTEGSELAILRSFPFNDYHFRVLTVEHNCSPIREDIRQFLEGKGYVRARDMGIDDGYVWHEDMQSVRWRGMSRNLFRSRK